MSFAEDHGYDGYASQYEERLVDLKMSINREIWKTKDGEEIPILLMDDNHLMNCINLLANQPNRTKYPDWAIEGYLKVLTKEAEKRKLINKEH